MKETRLLLLLSATLYGAHALDNGLAATPVLGWNTWKTCGDADCTHDYCDEHEVMSVAQAMLDNGMQALGWNYINLDDCWAYSRDNVTGALTWDTDRFPSGIPALATWLHDRGFKFGLYTSIGDATCSSGGRPITVPGSEGHYQQDAQSFADWGVDYVKLDWCGDVKHHFAYYAIEYGAQWHKEFAQALNATGRPVFLEVVAGYWFLKHETADYANSWRFCEDHHDDYESTAEAITCRIDQGNRPFNLTRGESGAWPYNDFLMTGGNGCAPFEAGVEGVHCPGQTINEYVTEFTLWSIAQSPLVVSTDVRNLTTIMQAALLNSEILTLHQSTATPPGQLVAGGYLGPGNNTSSSDKINEKSKADDDLCYFCQVWLRTVSLPNQPSGQVAVALVNWRANTNSTSMTSSASAASSASGISTDGTSTDGSSADGTSAGGNDDGQAVTATWDLLGLAPGTTVTVRDLWAHQDLANATDSITAVVPPGGTKFFLLTPVA